MRLSPFLYLTIFIIFFYTHLQAQQSSNFICADEQLTTLLKKVTPGYEQEERQKNLVLKEYINQMLKGAKPVLSNIARTNGDSDFVIPVVVHVIYPAGEPYGTGSNISYAQIRSQLEALNAAFSKSYPSYNNQSHPSYAQDTRIRFCLARLTGDTSSWAAGPGGTEFGVKRYANTTGDFNHAITFSSATNLLGITHPNANQFPFHKYMNIWLVKTIGGGNNVIGYAPRPIMSAYPLDGVVMRADVFGDNTTGGNYPLNTFGLSQGKILAHEVGHYLNLYHIFQGGCAGANAAGSLNNACDLNGDMICDIEPSITQNIYCTGDIPNTCTANYTAGTTTLDMINDYMSYADDDCMNTFTLDQSKRMWATLYLERQNLWQSANLVATGVLGLNGCIPSYLNSRIITGDAVLCAKKPITFSNPVAGNTATSFQWQFPGANITSANTNAVTVTYNTAANYKVILRVTDGTNSRIDSLLFSVLDCKLDSSMLHMSNWYFGNYGSVNFSSGAPVQTNTAFINNTIKGELAYPQQLQSFIAGTVSLSDSMGNLLFYSNGVSVWNKNHQKITSSSMFGVSDINASSGLSYVPYPGSPGKYFIIGAYPNFNEAPSGVRFVLVDVNTNTVSPYQEFQHPSLPNRFSQLLTVVPHCNGSDYWIISKGFGLNDPKFYSFLVTQAGINNTQLPVISNSVHPAFGGSGNQLKSNRLGDKLILGSPHGYLNIEAGAVYDFDNNTGIVKNERKLPNITGYSNIQTGVAFSPNGEYFYLMRSSNLATNGLPYWLFQYRVSDLQYRIMNAPGFYFAASFQPGPDNQIYITTQDHFLARVSNPDKWGGVIVNGSFINMRQLNDNIRPGVRIPSFIDAKQPQPRKPEFTVVAINCNTFRFSTLCLNNFTANWNFGDGSPVQTGNTIIHSYTLPGEFSVSLSLFSGNTLYGTASKKISVLPLISTISGPDYVCTNSIRPTQYFSSIGTGVNYKWTVTNGAISGPDNFPFVDVIWINTNGNGMVQLQITRDSCAFNTSKSVALTKGAAFNWKLKDSVCVYDSSFVLGATPGGGSFKGKGIANNRFYPSLAGLGNHIISYTYFDESTCLSQIEKTIKVQNCNLLQTPNSDCEKILNNIYIAPNPIKDLLQFKSLYILQYVQVYNFTGQKVAEGQLNNNSLRLPVLAAGVYLVKVYCNNKISYKTFHFLK